MQVSDVVRMAGEGRLYPSVILHGGSAEIRRDVAVEISRALLCERPATERPCGDCSHCARLVWPGTSETTFHPDLHVLERDLKTSTSIAGAKRLVEQAAVSPYEARGQVFVIAEAETLTPGGANALLKTLEEPYDASPRNFLLLSPSQFDLLPTLRSRSLAVFLGVTQRLEMDSIEPLAEAFGAAFGGFVAGRNPVFIMAAARALLEISKWDDPRDTGPWQQAAAGVSRAAAVAELDGTSRNALLALASDLLEGWRLRLRGIPARRIVEGLVAKQFVRV